MGIFGGSQRGQLRGNARPGVFGGNAQMPGAVPVETQRPGLGTRLLGQGWEGKLAALGGLMMGNANAVSDYHGQNRAQQGMLDQRAYEQAQAMRERSLEREDWQWQQDYQRNNPGPTAAQRNYDWYSDLTPEERQTYQEMNPVWRQGPDGQFYRVDTNTGQMPTFTEDDWNNAGGTAGNSGGGFR